MMAFFRRYCDYLTLPSTLPGLDWLRAIACLSVVCFHSSVLIDPISVAFRFGWMGVDLFFVLSGFLIGSILFKTMNSQAKFSYATFIGHRFLRIYPLFLFIFFAGALLKGSSLLHADLWRDFLIHFFQMQTLYRLFGLSMDEVRHGVEGSWTLSIEWLFYMAAPLLVYLVNRLNNYRAHYGLYALITLFFSGIFVRLLLVSGAESTDYSWFFAVFVRPPGRYDVLVAGVITAYIVQFLPPPSPRIMAALALTIISGFVAYLFFHHALLINPALFTVETIFYPALAGIGFGALLLASRAVRYAPRVVNILARLSYSMYLVHFLVLWVAKHHGWIDFNLLTYLSMIIGISFLLNLFIEYPALTLYKKRKI